MNGTTETTARRKVARRLRPDVVRQRLAQQRASELEKLYETPVTKLSPDEIRKMKAAFFLQG
jgi:hypothetical protein